jgi:hypothetical protein
MMRWSARFWPLDAAAMAQLEALPVAILDSVIDRAVSRAIWARCSRGPDRHPP